MYKFIIEIWYYSIYYTFKKILTNMINIKFVLFISFATKYKTQAFIFFLKIQIYFLKSISKKQSNDY